MPFMPLRRRALPELESLGCPECHQVGSVLHHYTNKGGIKQSGVMNHPEQREKDLSKEQDFSKEAFCSFSCFELRLSRGIPAPKFKIKRPF